MNIFVSRVRCAWFKRCTAKEMLFATLVLLVIMAACGIAGKDDEEDRLACAQDFTLGHRRQIVATWSVHQGNHLPLDH